MTKWRARAGHQFQQLRQNLTYLDDHPISYATLVVVLLLDFFILISVFEGLADQTRQLTRPDQAFPQICRDLFIQRDWQTDNQLQQVAGMINRYRTLEYHRDKASPHDETCSPVMNAVENVINNNVLGPVLFEYQAAQNQIRQQEAVINRLQGAEQTRLLKESIGEAANETPTISGEMSSSITSLDAALAERRAMEGKIAQDETVIALLELADGLTEDQQTALVSALRSANFWYPVKRLGLELLFLSPLLLVFYYWNLKSLERQRPFQTLVSSHLLVVVFIPVILKFAELIYDILPYKLLERLLDILAGMHLLALWHYLVMAVVIGLSVMAIYFMQQKLFSHQRLMQKRIARGQCQDCGIRLPDGADACPSCGYRQYHSCAECGELTLRNGSYCMHCGEAQ